MEQLEEQYGPCLYLQNALSEELANMKKIQDDLLANKVR